MLGKRDHLRLHLEERPGDRRGARFSIQDQRLTLRVSTSIKYFPSEMKDGNSPVFDQDSHFLQEAWGRACGKPLRQPFLNSHRGNKFQFDLKTSQELRILSSVTINCQVTKIVMNSGSQLSEL